ncbi:MAG TPA: DegT/DnrJ/EryC1/StrS family aminotransferase [Candidatus Dormibacteraeota bacterium]|nr:DegT/DnrJ/EryC1/StrS family aminotransferase [Candidatus Dormibacteraeota bacterium]
MGSFGAFSVYPSKNLSAYGDAGANTANDAGLAEKVRTKRNYASGPGTTMSNCLKSSP